jgi:tetraprenyl-beta-curcumene synthase
MRTTPEQPISLMWAMYRDVLPQVKRGLDDLRARAERIPDEELRQHALASLSTKAFHCQGGCAYALLAPNSRDILIPLIISLQTISDYLDNLCDRSISLDGDDFRLLHQAMVDAVEPEAGLHDYYALRGHLDDGGYLAHLVRTCQSSLRQLPNYHMLADRVLELVRLYSDLQVYKHIAPARREAALQAWWSHAGAAYPQLAWQEFAAATGSTLGMFGLFALAAQANLTSGEVEAFYTAYFPYVQGLHILLDYVVDQAEDEQGGDLNFCSYYASDDSLYARLLWLYEQAKLSVMDLPKWRFHGMILEGLVALYFSDDKIRQQPGVKRMVRIVWQKTSWVSRFFWINSAFIRKILYR